MPIQIQVPLHHHLQVGRQALALDRFHLPGRRANGGIVLEPKEKIGNVVYICEIGSVNTSFGELVGYEKGTIVTPSGVQNLSLIFSYFCCMYLSGHQEICMCPSKSELKHFRNSCFHQICFLQKPQASFSYSLASILSASLLSL
jgi:hypothetical protein